MQISHVRMRVFDAVSRGLDVTLIVPERRVRAAVTRSLREHFGDSGWNVVALDAHKSFQAVPLLPLATAGVVDSQDLRVQSVGPAIDALAARLTKNPRRSVVVVADGQWLDPLTCGAILTATARADVAVVTVQSTAPDEPPADGILIELPHLDRADFAEAVEAHTGLRLGSASLSRLRTSTGARLDLAVAVVHAARWNGGLRALAGGEQRLVGRLWTPELRPTLERELEDIDARTRGVLESIALRGGIRSEELADALGTDRLRELEREGRIELAPDRDGPVFLVTPPLMAEHLRMTAPRVRLESIDDTGSLAAPSRWDPRVHRSVLEQASTLVRAHKERALHRVHDARAVWARANGALPAATELLRACTAVDGHEREIGRLLAETDTARGAPDERADWIDARWTYEAWCRGVLPDVGAEDLADLPACARVRLHLREKELSHALLVHLDEEELDRLVREVEEDGRPEYAVRARFLAASAAVQRFDFDAAQAHLDHIRSQSACPRGMLLFLEALVALGRGDLAAVRTSIAEGFAGESCELDLREAAAFAMLTVTLSVIGAPIVQSEEVIELASLFGIPVPSASNPFHALALSAITLTAWDPHHGHVLRFVHVEEPDALPPGPLRDLLAVWTETLREGADAGECLVALVPRLWDAGARFSATGVATVLTDMDMSPSDLMELAGWFRRAPGAVAGAYAAYAEARAVGDGAGLLAVAETFDALELDGQRRTGSPQLSVTRSAVRPRTRALAALTAALLVLGGGAVASTVSPQAAHAAPGDAFDPADPYVFIGQDIPTRLYTAITDASGTVSFTPEGPVANIGYNALAYNTQNNYLYAISRSPAVTGFPSGSLIRIGQGGVITRVGSNTFTASLAGVFGPDNYLYILTASSTGAASQGLTRINVTTGAQVGSIINLSNPVGTSTWGGGPDFAYKDGYFWMLGYGYLVRVNPSNGQTTRWPLSTVLGSQAPSRAPAPPRS